MRITFVISSLEVGGAQRVLVLLTGALAIQGHFVSIVTLNGKENDFFDLPDGVERASLNISSSLQTLLRFPSLRLAILSTKPDVVISFIEIMNIMVLVALRGTKVPVIVSERTDPNAYSISPIWKCLRWWTYPFADKIVVQTTAVRNFFRPKFQSKVCVIPNPVIAPKTTKIFSEHLPKPFLIAVGRLYHYKGFDLLLKAFARLKNHHPDWTLIILGEGPSRDEIQSLQFELKLTDSVRLLGEVDNPYNFLIEADLFVMSSRFEGFPNALCEAMACGLPVISTNCPSGPQEIIQNGLNGLLVPNEDSEALSEAMDQLMSNKAERHRLGQNASKIVEGFNLEKVVSQWEETIRHAISEK